MIFPRIRVTWKSGIKFKEPFTFTFHRRGILMVSFYLLIRFGYTILELPLVLGLSVLAMMAEMDPLQQLEFLQSHLKLVALIEPLLRQIPETHLRPTGGVANLI
jgi:hypothetical protein